ncbi:flavodoxin FldB [Psychromonas ossibalaenae]|uniref:flavodoxin FldB n=1 Tax=Psychromonas ossibalaenae TaxID=444922 RepID=UPI000368A6D9|nr:flavodoxin FldB [Psychromonas ossibalaenae]
MKIGLFYGSSTCYTEIAAEKIQACIGADLVDVFNIKTEPLSKINNYDILILGISTWDYGELQEDWGAIWNELESVNVSGKIIALYGLGDQEGYGEWFIDAVGMLHEQLSPQEPKFVGYWPTEGYRFSASKALTADSRQFMGLALDEDSQYELSDERIEQWCLQILQEIELLL